ncbi:hypothetical protein Scep_007508 [Stephania cephalantha]|uniref:Uncharacterized protein n=1 Tax=Stephania cephalantha TaxID=152367 RepID=A0AAP0PQ47_9MAGN
MRDFLWQQVGKENASYLMAWKDCTLPKEYGGLGIGSLTKWNSAILAKHLWRLPRELGSLWAQVIFSNHGRDLNGWDTGEACGITVKSLWKYIGQEKTLLYQGIELKVGNGERIKFWQDRRQGERAFQLDFPYLYMFSNDREATVRELIGNLNGVIVPNELWSLGW